MSSSDEEASLEEEKWDDMAIVRAFEDAMNGKRKEKNDVSSVERSGRSRARKDASRRRRSVDSAGGSASLPGPEASPMASNGANAANHAAASFQSPQTLSSEEIYQAAYAQAYAHLQGQWQAAQYHQQSAPAPSYPHSGFSFPPTWANGVQPGSHVYTPPAMPFPSAPGVPQGYMPAVGSQDELANLLMSWYQSGYYTGRYQAMQEMRTREFR